MKKFVMFIIMALILANYAAASEVGLGVSLYSPKMTGAEISGSGVYEPVSGTKSIYNIFFRDNFKNPRYSWGLDIDLGWKNDGYSRYITRTTNTIDNVTFTAGHIARWATKATISYYGVHVLMWLNDNKSKGLFKIGLGIGSIQTKLEQTLSNENTGVSLSGEDKADGFAYCPIILFTYKISETFKLNLEGRYIFANPEISDSSENLKLDGAKYGLGISYYFK